MGCAMGMSGHWAMGRYLWARGDGQCAHDFGHVGDGHWAMGWCLWTMGCGRRGGGHWVLWSPPIWGCIIGMQCEVRHN